MTDKIKSAKIVQIKGDNLQSILKLLNGNKYVKQIQWSNDEEPKGFNIILDIEVAKGKEICVTMYNDEHLVVSENGEINKAYIYDMGNPPTYKRF